MKQPWSCWAGEGQALEHQGLRTVTPCVLFIPVSVDTGLQPCNVTTACRLNTPRLILVPWSYPPCPDKGQLLCRIGSAKTLPLAVMIWGLWHSQGLHGVRYCLKVIILVALWAVGAGDVAAANSQPWGSSISARVRAW